MTSRDGRGERAISGRRRDAATFGGEPSQKEERGRCWVDPIERDLDHIDQVACRRTASRAPLPALSLGLLLPFRALQPRQTNKKPRTAAELAMDNTSSDLQWILTRVKPLPTQMSRRQALLTSLAGLQNTSSKIVKRGGAGFLLSREEGNLK